MFRSQWQRNAWWLWVTCGLCVATVSVAQDRSRSVSHRNWWSPFGRTAAAPHAERQPDRSAGQASSRSSSELVGVIETDEELPSTENSQPNVDGFVDRQQSDSIEPGRWQSPRQEIVNDDAFPWDEPTRTESVQLPPHRQPVSRSGARLPLDRRYPLSAQEGATRLPNRRESRIAGRGLPKLGMPGRHRWQAVKHQTPGLESVAATEADESAVSDERLPSPLYPEAVTHPELVPDSAPRSG